MVLNSGFIQSSIVSAWDKALLTSALLAEGYMQILRACRCQSDERVTFSFFNLLSDKHKYQCTACTGLSDLLNPRAPPGVCVKEKKTIFVFQVTSLLIV